jgi:hypothetical protein
MARTFKTLALAVAGLLLLAPVTAARPMPADGLPVVVSIEPTPESTNLWRDSFRQRKIEQLSGVDDQFADPPFTDSGFTILLFGRYAGKQVPI